jgi:MFS family permease
VNEVRRIIVGRTVRAFADGFVAVLLARYLTDLGFTPLQVGAIVTGTLLGSAALTLGFGFRSRRTSLAALLVVASGLMVATGAAYGTVTAFWPLLVIAVVGTLNPSGGDVSVFLPTEQAYLADLVEGEARTRLYARYNLAAVFAGAVGALASGLPERIAVAGGWSLLTVERLGFAGYAAAGLVLFVLYRPLPRRTATVGRPATDVSGPVSAASRRRGLGGYRHIVLQLAALFSIDSAGSGFVGTSLLVLWLHLRFGLGRDATAAVFFAAGLLGACSQLAAPVLARRIGMIRTMAYTHIPANLMLAAAALVPSAPAAIALLLGRALFAQMDVPARQAFVMAVVPAEHRAAASSITNVPRSLAAAGTPLVAGALLSATSFGWPLIIAGVTKLAYDLTLLALHRNTPESVADLARS